VNHARAKAQVWLALRLAIAARGLGCEALPDGATVRIDDRTVYEPDALVRCGPPLPGDAIEADDPVIVVEVVSPSSRGIDKGVKLASYFSLPSVRHYLIVDTDKQVVIHHHLVEDGRIESRFLGEGPLTLDPPGLTIEVRDIFAGP
jgi:Uma2 family endonuclease